MARTLAQEMKYDDASWHSGGDFPSDLPPEAGATHTGMFLTWCILSGHAGEELIDICDDEGFESLKSRTTTPGQFFLEWCDGKFTELDVDEAIHPFIESYFDFEKGSYIGDYHNALATSLPSDYHVPDTWESYDKIAPVISKAYEQHKG